MLSYANAARAAVAVERPVVSIGIRLYNTPMRNIKKIQHLWNATRKMEIYDFITSFKDPLKRIRDLER